MFEIPRGVSCRVNMFSNIAGRVGSGQQIFKSRGSGCRVGLRGLSKNLAGQVGSGQDIYINIFRLRETTRPVRFDLTRENT